MTGIIVAIPKEADPIIAQFSDLEQLTLAGKKTCTGTVGGKPAALIVCDVGKVNAASAAQALITRFGCKKMLNFGVCGGIREDLNICDLLLAKQSIQYDFDVTELDRVPVGYIQNLKTHMLPCDAKLFEAVSKHIRIPVTVATADRFSSSEANAQFVRQHGGDVVDMELAAIAQVCLLNNVALASVKCVSDNARGDAKHDFNRMLVRASGLLGMNFKDVFQAVSQN